jgi:hypothetical protein
MNEWMNLHAVKMTFGLLVWICIDQGEVLHWKFSVSLLICVWGDINKILQKYSTSKTLFLRYKNCTYLGLHYLNWLKDHVVLCLLRSTELPLHASAPSYRDLFRQGASRLTQNNAGNCGWWLIHYFTKSPRVIKYCLTQKKMTIYLENKGVK